jgi:hypothetical protein
MRIFPPRFGEIRWLGNLGIWVTDSGSSFNVVRLFKHNDNGVETKAALTRSGVKISVNRLIDFAAQGDQNTVSLLLAAGVSPTACDPARCVTALHNAASQGHIEIMRMLLGAKATVDARDWQGQRLWFTRRMLADLRRSYC